MKDKILTPDEEKLYEKLKIAFKYGIKVAEKHPDNDDCDEVYLDRAIAVIKRLYPKKEYNFSDELFNEAYYKTKKEVYEYHL